MGSVHDPLADALLPLMPVIRSTAMAYNRGRYAHTLEEYDAHVTLAIAHWLRAHARHFAENAKYDYTRDGCKSRRCHLCARVERLDDSVDPPVYRLDPKLAGH